jgi:hypothetical protein
MVADDAGLPAYHYLCAADFIVAAASNFWILIESHWAPAFAGATAENGSVILMTTFIPAKAGTQPLSWCNRNNFLI